MPIRPENRDRYPADWKAISAEVREEAGNRCEWCGVENGRWIQRGATLGGVAVWRYANASAYECGRSAETGDDVADTEPDLMDYGRAVKVVLTVAHMDHQPENCCRENLKALCQRCHNRYDAPMRRNGIKARAKASLAVADMFDEALLMPSSKADMP